MPSFKTPHGENQELMKITKLFIAAGLALLGTASLFGAQTNLVQALQINLGYPVKVDFNGGRVAADSL